MTSSEKEAALLHGFFLAYLPCSQLPFTTHVLYVLANYGVPHITKSHNHHSGVHSGDIEGQSYGLYS